MIEREFAIRLVEAQLEREYRRELAVYGESLRAVVARVQRHELGWIIAWQSEEYARTGDSSHALVGNGPYLVDGKDGSLHQIAVVDFVTGAWEADYRARVRGERPRGPVDELASEIRAVAVEHGRVHALRLLRQRVPALGIAEAKTYLTAVEAGAAPPAALVALAEEALLPSSRQAAASGVEAITGPNPPTAGELPAPPLLDFVPHRRKDTAERCEGNFVGDFRELRGSGKGAPSIHDAACLQPRAHEAELAAYLRAGSVLAASPAIVYDEVRGDGTVIGGLSIQTDGRWFWYSDLAYYVETYHLALDDRFLVHAASRDWQPPQLGLAELLALEDQLGATGPAHPPVRNRTPESG